MLLSTETQIDHLECGGHVCQKGHGFVARWRLQPCPECKAPSEPSGCGSRWDPEVCPYCGDSGDSPCCDKFAALDPKLCPKCGGPARYLDWLDFVKEPEPDPPPDWALQFLSVEASLAAGENGSITELELQAYFALHRVPGVWQAVHRLMIGICNGHRQTVSIEDAAERSREQAIARASQRS